MRLETHAFRVLQPVGDLARGAAREPRRRRADVPRQSGAFARRQRRCGRPRFPAWRLCEDSLVDPVNACDYDPPVCPRGVDRAELAGKVHNVGRASWTLIATNGDAVNVNVPGRDDGNEANERA